MRIQNKLMPVVMIILVLMLPVHSAFVFAQHGSLRNVNVHGQDDIENTIRAYGDALQIELEAARFDSNDNPVEVDPGNLIFTINGQGSYEFDSCQAGTGDWYECTYSGEARDWDVTKHEINIKLYDDKFVRLDETTENLCVDVDSPQVDSFDMPDSATTDPIDISYSLSDSSNDDCPGICSGLNKAELKKKNETFFTDSNASGCSYSNTYTTTPAKLNLKEGENKICLEVYDNTEKSSESCRKIFVDYNAPQFVGGSVNLTDQEGNVIKYSSPRISNANLEIKAKESISKIEAEDVIANLTSLYRDMGDKYENVQADKCSVDNNTYTCGWYDFKIKGDGSDTAELDFKIADVAGNSFTQSITLDVPYDDENPTVSKVKTGNDKYLKSEDNTVKAKIKETISGMAKGNAYADLHSLDSSYGFNKKTDECVEEDGSWFCYWENINVEDKKEGSNVPVVIKDVEDDAGNLAAEEFTGDLVYDSVAPEIVNATIKPLGVDMDVLRDGDVAEITATIKDEVSGIEKENVLADYGDIYPEKNWTSAESCNLMEGSDSKYKCRWEYAGPLQPDEWIEMDFKVKDNAGNEKLEEDAAEIFVAEIEEKKVDFWEDTISTETSELNPNFLWMSSSGTMQRVNFGLSPKSSRPYVHNFRINECKGTLGGNESFQSYDIVRQYTTNENELMNLVLNIPNYKKDAVKDVDKIKIKCSGEIIQARSETGSVFEPNEKVNVSIAVPLMDGLFQEPGASTVNRIEEGRSQVENINKVVDVIDTLSFLRPLCQAFNSIRNILNNVCILWKTVKTAVSGDATSGNCAWASSKLEKLWHGDKKSEAGTEFGPLKSQKNVFSVGFLCDLYLCTGCNNQWSSMLSDHDKTDFLTKDWMPSAGGDEAKSSSIDEPCTNKACLSELSLNGAFDPMKSLPVAVFCMPPCLTGIKNTLLRYKQILVNYNVCMNVASVRGEGSSQCEEYKSTQTCRWVVGWFWSWVEGAISQFITNTVFNWLNKGYQEMVGYNEEKCSHPSADFELTCSPKIIYSALGLIESYNEIQQSLKNFEDLETSFEDEQDVEEDLESTLDGNETAEGAYPYE